MKPFRLTIKPSLIARGICLAMSLLVLLPSLQLDSIAVPSANAANGQPSSGQQNFELRVKLSSGLSTKKIRPGDDVTAKVIAPPEFAGDYLEGTVTESKSSGKVNKTAVLTFNFTKLQHNGEVFNIVSTVVAIIDPKNRQKVDEEGNVSKSTNNTGIIVGSTAGGAAAGGAAAGTKGAVIGAGIGATIGMIIGAGRNKGTKVKFDPESEIVIAVHRCGNCPSSIFPSESGTVRPRLRRGGGTSTMGSSSGSVLPAPPASTYRNYNYNGYFSFNLPTNWQEFPSGGAITFAPENGYSTNQQGAKDFSYGVMVGVANAQGRDLRQGTTSLINGLLSANSGMRQQGSLSRTTVSGREAMMSTLIGKSTLGGGAEIVTVYTTVLRNGSLLYMLMIVPDDEQQTYSRAFSDLVSSIRFYD
jgi:hypothetical protein